MLALSLPPLWAILAFNVLRLSQSFGSLLNVLSRLLLPMAQFLLLLLLLAWVFSLTMHLLLSDALDVEFGSLPASMYFIVKAFFSKYEFETFDAGRAGGGSFTGPVLVVGFLVSTNLYLVRVLIAMLTLRYNKFDTVSTQENLFARTVVVMESRNFIDVPPVPLNLVSGLLGYFIGPAMCGCSRKSVQLVRLVANYIMIWVPFIVCTLPITFMGLVIYLCSSLVLWGVDAFRRRRQLRLEQQQHNGHGEQRSRVSQKRFSLSWYRHGTMPQQPLFSHNGMKADIGEVSNFTSGDVVAHESHATIKQNSAVTVNDSRVRASAIQAANRSPSAPHEQHKHEMHHRHLAVLRKKRLSHFKRRLTLRSWVAQNFGGQASALLRRQSRSKWDDSSNVFHERNLKSAIEAVTHAKKLGSAADAHAVSKKELYSNKSAQTKHTKRFRTIVAKNKRLKILMLLESALEFGDAMSADARLVHIQQLQERQHAKLRRELFAIRSKLTQVLAAQSSASIQKVDKAVLSRESRCNTEMQQTKANKVTRTSR